MSRHQLNRVQVINFHNFTHEIIPGGRNLFLMGDNKSGKTTVLDAIHFALTGGKDLDLNVAARFGTKQEASRNLASIFLRLDGPTGKPRRGPTISYVAIETKDAAGATHVFGCGAFTPTLDSTPDIWGFVASNQTLDSVEILLEEADEGRVRKRPRDEAELAERLGKGNVFGDKGRYRTAVAKFLFQDREAYERAMELLRTAKSYRSIVAKAHSLDDLFVSLLPTPNQELYKELRPAITSIDAINADLELLEEELALIQQVVAKLNEARSETEHAARLHFVLAERLRRHAAKVHEKAVETLKEARQAAEEKAGALQKATEDLNATDGALRSLRASEDAALVERLRELSSALGQAEDALNEIQAERRRSLGELAHLQGIEEEATRRARGAVDVASQTLREQSADVLEQLGHQPHALLRAYLHDLDELGLEHRALPDQALDHHARLQRAWSVRRDESAKSAAKARERAATLTEDAAGLEAQAKEVLARGETLPSLGGYSALLRDIDERRIDAVPLYRLYELDEGLLETLGHPLEILVGQRALGCIVAPETATPAAREIVLAHGNAVEVATDPEAHDETALPDFLRYTGPPDLARKANAYMAQLFRGLVVLPDGARRGNAPRAIWPDGSTYDQGIESAIPVGPPTFLGREARRKAAERSAAQLTERAGGLRDQARELEGQANRDDLAAAAAEANRAKLDTCGPLLINARLDAAFLARENRTGHELRHASVERRTESAAFQVDTTQRKRDEVQNLVNERGAEGLRQRIEDLETQFEGERRRKDLLIGEAATAVEVKNQKERAEEDARAALAGATATVTRRGDALRPLVEPKYQEDLIDYAFRIKKGDQFRTTENISDEISAASDKRSKAYEAIRQISHNEILWQKYAFTPNEDAREVRDQTGKLLEDVALAREEEVAKNKAALDEKTRDLFDRVLVDGLVKHLLTRIEKLQTTIKDVNKLCSDLRFGTARFRFDVRPRTEYKGLIRLMQEGSILDATTREEIKDFFLLRIDELKKEEGGGDFPELLDYRAWFHYTLQTANEDGTEWIDLTSKNLGFGSTGEQAVPNHMLVIAVAGLLYDEVGARLSLLLMDEAFLGIDAQGREILLRFADRAGVNLVVATPELDGLTPALAASTTLLIEKNAEGDVFVQPFPWTRAPQQSTLTLVPDEVQAASRSA